MVKNVLRVDEETPTRTDTRTPSANSRPDTVEIPVRLCSLPPLNAIANQVLTLSTDADVDLQRLGAVMECDPAFAADVLFLANSSLFGFPSRIQALRHGIAVLGLDRIRSLSVTVAMRSFVGKGGPLIRQCWRHSAACAIIAREISQIFNITNESAYALGLLHDVGRLGLLKSYADEYSGVLKSVFDDVDQVLRAERAVLQIDHGVAGAWLVKSWAFPATFAHTCEHHHDPVDSKDSELLQVIKLSCRIADAVGCSAVQYTKSSDYEAVFQSLPPQVPRHLFPSEDDLRAKVEDRLKSFA